MTYIRRRNTKAGSVSTALVESYRDEKGRPRQRLLANLHGEPDTVSALAKLEFKRDALRNERASDLKVATNPRLMGRLAHHRLGLKSPQPTLGKPLTTSCHG
jgi:hypothetical protein